MDGLLGRAVWLASVAQPPAEGGFQVSALQALAALLVALVAAVYAAQKFVFERYLPQRQENQAVERKAEREHEQSLVSKLTDQSADLQSKLFEVVTQRLGGIEQTSQTAAADVGKLVGQVESLAGQVRTTQLELRELRGQISAAVGASPLPTPAEEMPPPNPRPGRRATEPERGKPDDE